MTGAVIAPIVVPTRGRLGDDLVVDVGEVHRPARTAHPRRRSVAAQQILEQKRAKISDVRRVVHGGPARVHAHRLPVGRRKWSDRARHGVVQPVQTSGHRRGNVRIAAASLQGDHVDRRPADQAPTRCRHPPAREAPAPGRGAAPESAPLVDPLDEDPTHDDHDGREQRDCHQEPQRTKKRCRRSAPPGSSARAASRLVFDMIIGDTRLPSITCTSTPTPITSRAFVSPPPLPSTNNAGRMVASSTPNTGTSAATPLNTPKVSQYGTPTAARSESRSARPG